ncbi:hypothetical protein EJ04DRAFT_562032 [Polyplosphaeria fusca]|uniref:Uncharacterized protein n=1 Tax=Polyplosphaeria fusca TaxID=682080 RepID=A0A9P4V3R2_9PLEO|nr:hypothetical protein EJ04DRAFT_562032 [Polyplosphaeria fusca]
MSEVDDHFVKHGMWVDRDRGQIMGQTITTSAQIGNVIIVVLTILVSIASAQLWNLVAFFYHQFRARGDPSDGLFWQQQALLRTLPTPTSMIADTVKLYWVWRGKVQQPLSRSMLPLLAGIFFAFAALAGGIFSSYVVDTTNLAILVDSPLCAMINLTALNNGGNGIDTLSSNLQGIIDTYSRNCYINTTYSPAQCRNVFIKPKIPFAVDAAPCPWNSSMCSTDALPAMSMDSGLLDVNKYFGLNVEGKDGVKFRRKTTCNVLPIQGHMFVRNFTYWHMWLARAVLPEEQGIALQYGRYRVGNISEQPLDDTFYHSLSLSNLTDGYTTDQINGLLEDNPDYIGIKPLPEMARNDSDLVVMAVWQNSIRYNKPVDDPLFSAHKVLNRTTAIGKLTRYGADYPAGVVGCAEQTQYCHARSGKDDYCTPMSGLPPRIPSSMFPEANPLQLSTLRLLRDASQSYDIANGISASGVLANSMVSAGEVPELPSDQWKKEVLSWQSFGWAGMQTFIATALTGPKELDPSADSYTIQPTSEGDKQLCKALKMRKTGGFANINVFGLAFVTTFSLTILLFNLSVLRFMIFLSRFRKTLGPRIDRWVQDGVFQLQRRAFDAYGEGVWINLEKEIPATISDHRLSELPIESLDIKGRQRAMLRTRTWKTDVTAVSLEGQDLKKESLEKNDDEIMPVPAYSSDAKVEAEAEEERKSYVPQQILDERAQRNKDR